MSDNNSDQTYAGNSSQNYKNDKPDSGKQHVLSRATPIRYFALISSIGHSREGKPYCKGKLSTVDLLVLTSSDQGLFMLNALLIIATKQATLMRRSTLLNLPL
jgi:hypothetical protein